MSLRTRLIQKFKNVAYRHSYADSFLDSYLATQIKVLREQRGLTQATLAKAAGMKQSQVSRLENVNNGRWTVSTLRRIAQALDLALVVRFESFGTVVAYAESFERQALERPLFGEDPVFAGVSGFASLLESLQINSGFTIAEHAENIIYVPSAANFTLETGYAKVA